MRICSKCREAKPLTEFSQWINKATGKQEVNAKCKQCVASYSRRRYSEKRDELRAAMKERYANNREQAIVKAKAYYEENKEKVLEGRRRHYEANKSAILIKCAEWKAKNPEKYKAAQAKWQTENTEKHRESCNKYYSNNKERVAERRKLMRFMVMEAYGGAKCSCCGEIIFEFLTIDHMNEDGAEHRRAIGSHLYRWLIENDYPPGFQVLCFNCNMGKHLNGGICPHKDLEGSTTIESAPKGVSE